MIAARGGKLDHLVDFVYLVRLVSLAFGTGLEKWPNVLDLKPWLRGMD